MLREQGLEQGLLLQGLEQVREREPEQVREQVREQARGPKRHHNLWLQWRGSKMDFSSIRQRRFSKPHHQRCANC